VLDRVPLGVFKLYTIIDQVDSLAGLYKCYTRELTCEERGTYLVVQTLVSNHDGILIALHLDTLLLLLLRIAQDVEKEFALWEFVETF
jgi:hypothetical protein